ncbi:MAG: hypothetical protein HY268_08870 [Deltaproteobacteria bacterium]|nr:hypothetical protein [Deltaproteobacteria bacterium]
MKRLITISLVGFITLHISAARGADLKVYQTFQAYLKCVDQVERTLGSAHCGAGGYGCSEEITAKCGKPVRKKGTGYAMFKEECDGIYQTAFQDCLDLDPGCDSSKEGVFSQLAESWLEDPPPRVFDRRKFNELCGQVCKTRIIQNRKTFGELICGEP